MVELDLVARKPFIIGLGFAGIALALGAFAYVRWIQRPPSNSR